MKTKNLTIQEAIQSGLPFKREINSLFSDESNSLFTASDVMATDYEIKVPEVTITREKLSEAWDNMIMRNPVSCSKLSSAESSIAFNDFCKRLGL